MSKTFKEFMCFVEGKKEEIRKLKNAYLAGQQQSTPRIVDIPAGEPNSPERAEAIKKLMKMSGGGAVRRAVKKKQERAKEVAKKLLRNK